MKSKTETGSFLLRNTSVLLGSNLGDANARQASNLLIFLKVGKFKHGHHIANVQRSSIVQLICFDAQSIQD